MLNVWTVAVAAFVTGHCRSFSDLPGVACSRDWPVALDRWAASKVW
jgi:hypothetical protein